MAISYPTAARVSGSDMPISTPLSVTAVVIAPANLNRAPEGLLINNANQTLYVSMTGDPATTSGNSIPIPPNGGTLDIPGQYTGAISGIWAGAGVGSCIFHQYTYQ